MDGKEQSSLMTINAKSDKAHRGNNALPRRTVQLAEVSVFLFLIVPSMIISFFIVRQGSMSFVLIAVSIILRDLALVSLIIFFVWRNGERIELIGWSFKNVRKEAILGIWCFIPFFFGAGLIENGLRAAGFTAPATPLPSLVAEKNIQEYLLAAVMVLIVSLTEETIFRGYLVLRFKNVTGSTAATVLISTVIFALGHGYEGSAGVVTVGIMGVVFALIYIWRQTLVAPMVMHFLQDFVGIVLLPLLRMR